MAGYIGNIPVPQGTQTRQNFTATASQTSFPTIGYTTGFIDVYLNGVKLINGTDFTATNGSDVVLTSAASASDVLDVVIFDTFTSSNGTFNDATLKNNATLKNDTHEDSDGGRASKIIYQGEQSGGEISTLAEIQASHDGTADDQKGDLIFRTNDGSDGTSPTEAMRIDSLSRASIGSGTSGVTSGWWNSTLNSMVSIENNGVNTGSKYVTLGITRNTNDAEAPQLGFSHSRGTTHDSKTVLQSGDSIGTITFQGADGSEYVEGARISAIVDGTPGANDMPTRLVFRVTHDGAATTTEKLRIDEDGLKFNGDSAADNALSDFEQGTFTPTLKKGSHTNFTYVNQIGKYTKIGNVYKVSFYVFCNNTATTSNGATWELTGLPFSISSLANCAYQFAACGYLIIGNTNYGNNVHRWQANSSTSLSLYGQNSTQEHTGSNLELSGTGIITVA